MDKQEYDEMRLTEEKEKNKATRSQKIKKYAKKSVLLATVVLVLGGIGWYLAKSKTLSYDPLSLCIQHTNARMHIHPHLKIIVKGEEVKIPKNVGISATCMRPIHTHDDSGTLHLEFPNTTNIPLGNFFKVWEKPLSSFGNNPKMKVNGADNTELENYIMRDGDQIELYFE